MAIQPIDLQTLFSQMDKVGKSQAAAKDGLTVQQNIHGIENQRKLEENVQSVNEAQNTGEGAEAINDKNYKRREGGKPDEDKEKEKSEEEKAEEKKNSVIKDPALGRNIDISG
jgi:hypothetical protein